MANNPTVSLSQYSREAFEKFCRETGNVYQSSSPIQFFENDWEVWQAAIAWHQAETLARLEALKPCGGEMQAIGMSEMKRKAIAIVRGGV